MIIIYYFLFTFKNKKLDKFIIYFYLTNISIAFFLQYEHKEKIYTLNKYINNNGDSRNCFLLSIIFFMGCLFGLIYYYYIISIRQVQKIIKKDFYLPFSFIFSVIKYLSTTKKKVQMVVMFVTFILQICLVYVYHISRNIWLNEREFVFNFSFGFKLFYAYEKVLFVFLFGINILMLVLCNDSIWVKNLFKSRVFISFNRLAFCYFLTYEVFIYMFFALFDMTGFCWNYQTIIYISIFVFIVILFISVFLTVFVEIPLRIFIKEKTNFSNKIY
jgi:hypothetical protein